MKKSAAVTAVVVMKADVLVNKKGEFKDLDVSDIEVVQSIEEILNVDILPEKGEKLC